eukprot:3154523-Pyramimonas_sp.AAC.1
MTHWRSQGWTDRQVRHYWSMQYVRRNPETGEIFRSDRAGNAQQPEAMERKACERGLCADRKIFREVVRGCELFADRRPNCPMGRH